MEWLRKLIESAKKKDDGSIDIDDLMKQINAEFPKNAVPKNTYNDVSEQLKTANNTIKDLKKNNADNEELQKKVTDYEKQIKEQKEKYDAEIIRLGRESINNELLSKYKAKNNKAVMALVDDIEAKDNDTYRTLLDSKLKAISEADDTKFMFGESKPETHYNPAGGGEPTGKNPFAKETFNLTEQGKLLKENPAQAKELAAAVGVTLNI